MAIANSDGSIILSTKVDTSGVKKATNELRSEAMKLAAQYRKAGMTQSEAQKRAYKELGVTTQATEKATKATKKYGEQAQKSFGGLKSTLQSLAGYLALAFSVTKIIQFSNEAGKLATQTEASVQRLIDIYGSASDSVGNFIDQNARALGMSKAAAASFSSVYGNLFSVWADQETNARLTNEYLRMTAVVASKTGRTVEDVQERIRSGLLGNTESIEDLGIFVNVKTIEMTDAFKRMANGRSWEQLDAYTQQQIRSMAILEQATDKYGNQVAETSATTRAKFKAAYEDFKQSWGEIVNRVLLPVLEVLTSIFDIAIRGIEVLTGKSSNITDKIEEGTGNISGNIDESNKNQEDFNESLEEAEKTSKKLLANFDNLYILTSQDEGSSIIDNVESKLEISDGWGEDVIGNSKQEIDTELAELASTVGKYLTALGVILLVMGSVAWGIGFIVAGAGLYGVTEAALDGEGFNKEKIISDISFLAEQIGKLLLAIGALLVVLTGFNSKSLSILAFGALTYLIGKNGEEIAVQKWDIDSVKTAIRGALTITADVMLLVGMIMVVMTGFSAKSLTILAMGAIMKVNEEEGDTVSPDDSALSNFTSDVNGLIAWAAGASLLIGLALCYGGYWKEGLRFLAAGAAGVVFGDDSAKTSMVDTIFSFVEQILGTMVSALWYLITSIRDFFNWAIGKMFIAPVAEIADIFGAGDDVASWWEDLTGYSPRWGGWGMPSFGDWKNPSEWTGRTILGDKVPYSVTDTTYGSVPPTSTMSGTGEILTTSVQNVSNKTEIILELDGRELGRAIVEQGERESQRIGTRLVVI